MKHQRRVRPASTASTLSSESSGRERSTLLREALEHMMEGESP